MGLTVIIIGTVTVIITGAVTSIICGDVTSFMTGATTVITGTATVIINWDCHFYHNMTWLPTVSLSRLSHLSYIHTSVNLSQHILYAPHIIHEDGEYIFLFVSLSAVMPGLFYSCESRMRITNITKRRW